jgi:hypothetical protein
MSVTLTNDEVKSKALPIAMGTFLSSWEGTAEEAWARLTAEETVDSSDVDYIVVWEPFESESVEVLYTYIEELYYSIVETFS